MFAAATSAVMFGHQGGWDEFLLVVGPIVLIFGLLGIAKRRADQLHADGPAPGEGSDASAAPSDATRAP